MCRVRAGSRNLPPRVPFVAVPRLLAIAIGGVLGSLARYSLVLFFGERAPGDWPWATLSVNVVGALLIGALATSVALRERPPWVRLFAITGVLGGFTTFSAFALETGELLDSGRAPTALAYVVVTMVVGLSAVRIGSRMAGAR